MDFFYIDSLKQLEEGTFQCDGTGQGQLKKQIRYSNQSLFREGVFGRDGSVMGMEGLIMTAFLQNTQRLRRYAVCYEHQLEETLPTDQHDIYMHDIYTEREVIHALGQ